LAPVLVRSLAEGVRAINAQGMTILMVEQNAALAMSLAHRLYILDGGRMVGSGTREELEGSADLANAYLGGRGHALSTL